MTVTVTIEFTDEQWALIHAQHTCPVPKYDEIGEWLGTAREAATPEILAVDLKRRLMDQYTEEVI